MALIHWNRGDGLISGFLVFFFFVFIIIILLLFNHIYVRRQEDKLCRLLHFFITVKIFKRHPETFLKRKKKYFENAGFQISTCSRTVKTRIISKRHSETFCGVGGEYFAISEVSDNRN